MSTSDFGSNESTNNVDYDSPEVGIFVPLSPNVPAEDNVPAGGLSSVSGELAPVSREGEQALGTREDTTHVTILEGCGCAACAAFHAAETDGGTKGGGGINEAQSPDNFLGVLLPLGTNPDGSHFFTGNRNIDATLIGAKWGTTNLTFSFPTSGTNYNGAFYDSNGVSNFHIDLGSQQQAAARAGFAQLAAVSGLTFTEITETDTVHANIRISQTADSDAPSAYGGFPSVSRTVSGDIWFGRTNQPYYDLAFQGSWGFATMLHEIGHTMGLKHGHQDYTNLDLSPNLGGPPRPGSQALTPDRNGQAWSLMTYDPAPFTNSDFAGEKVNQPQTYMQYDLAALQYMYGANYNTNAGDSVYTFSQTTGEMFINGVGQGAPSGNKILLTVWDGGGNDTINASNYANGVTIDLRPGEFSTFDPAQLANHLAYQHLVALAPGNIAMSLLYNNDGRSLIENATGGVGNDVFVGNSANNILDGGAGSDTVIFTGTTGITVTLNDTAADVIVTHDGETDTLRSIENISGTIGNDTLTGNSQNNVLIGGGGADTLSGGGGDDRLIGGGFTTTTTLSAPSQPDITKPASTNNGSIATAVNTAGFFDVDANPDITNSTSIPHATINATATGGTVEYYRIDVTQAGAQAIFDIDGGGTLDDSIIDLVNSSGTLLATNDTGTGDVSFPGHDDAYLTYTFATAGTYYIRVGRYISSSVPQPMLAGQTYQLNISLQGAAVVTTTVSSNNTSSLVADGGQGNDFLQGTIADDILNGGDGSDTASYVNAFSGGSTTGVTVNLNTQGVAQNTVAAGNDTLTGIENLVGSALNDTLTGNASANVIEGGLGNDTLVGGPGDDTASYAGATAGVTVSLALQGSAQNTGVTGTDTLSGFQNLLGSAFNDSLTGDATENTLTGGAGDDTLNPGLNAVGATDLLDGGDGSDTASFAGQTGAVTVTLNSGADVIATVAGGSIAALRSIENLLGGDGNDVLTGDAGANSIDGGLGDDTLDGGLGVDTLTFRGSTGVTVNLANSTATGMGTDTFAGFENVRTGSGADNVTGDANDNVFFEGGGADVYNGAGGSDTLDYSAATSAVLVNLNSVAAQNTGTFGGSDTISNIENVVGAVNFSSTLQGNAQGNRFTGGLLQDIIIGNGGNDFIIGGAGTDTLLGGSSDALDDGSADTLEGGAGADYLSGGYGNDILRGGDGDDTLHNGIGNTSRQYYTAYDGGDDTFDGGDGTDTAIMIYEGRVGAAGSTVGVAFDLKNLAGNSDITFNGVSVGSLTSIESLIFRGTTVDDNVGGTGAADNLFGGAGDDVLHGWFGNDLLEGALGNDTLIGGEGLDTATYASSTAGVNVDLRLEGVAQDTGGAGVDTLTGVEYLTGSTFGDTLRGNDDFNLIVDTGTAATSVAGQTDSLFGYGGNDTLLVTRAAAISTNVNFDGGDGDDFIELRSGTLSVALLPVSGTGRLLTGLSTVGYAAAGTTSNTRNLDVVTVDSGTGNDRIILTGVASATVNTGAGADLLSISMRGATTVNNYLVTLGAGADIIQFGVGSSAATSLDVAVTARTNRVTDFEIGNAGDKFEMTDFLNRGLTGYTLNSNAFASGHLRLVQSGTDLVLQADRDGVGATNSFVTIFTISNGYTGGFTAFNFDGFIGDLVLAGFEFNETITGATGNDTLSGNDGNDVLIGLAGNDTLDGGNGNDLLVGGTGDDTLIGGAGIDTASYADATAGVTVDLRIVGAQATGMGSDNLSGIEDLIGSNFADTLTGDAADNRIEGGGGADVVSGGLGSDYLLGGAGNDGLTGNDGNDLLFGEAGEDDLDGGVGDDYLDGGDERDVLRGGVGSDYLVGGLGSDTLQGGADRDFLFGDEGEDELRGDDGDDYLAGGEGRDYLYGGVGADVLSGDAGNDNLFGDTGADELNGGVGEDYLNGGVGADILDGGDGDDYLDGGEDSDVLRGSAGADYLLGGAGDDTLLGGADRDYLSGGEGDDELDGGDGDDYLDGGNGRDRLSGGAGNDTVIGGIGNNVLFGDSGDDQLTGGDGDDYLDGGADRDLLTGGAGRDDLRGGDGRDTLLGGADGDLLFGDAGEDDLNGDEGDDYLDGGADRDVLRGGSGADYLLGGDGGDTLLGGADGDQLFGGAGEDELRGEDGDDYLDGGDGRGYLFGGNGADTLFGGADSDVLFGESGADFLNGGEGDDYLDGGAERDVLVGAGGRDYLIGGADDDTLLGGADGDILFGGDGGDTIQGDAGDDYLDGGAGNDLVIGGAGADTLLGGAGADVFVMVEAGDSSMDARDTIIDFDRSQGDVIDLSSIDANSGSDGSQAFSFIGTAAFTNTAGELRYEVINGVTNVFADTNGDGVADMSFAVNLPDLQSTDFLL